MIEIQKNDSGYEENSIRAENTETTIEANHQNPSHLRQRWKRKSAPSATIREDHAKQPKELKTVQIATAERLNYQETSVKNESKSQPFLNKPNGSGCRREDRKRYETHSRESCRCHSYEPKGDCVCRAFWNKLKRFTQKLLAIGSKEEKSCKDKKKVYCNGSKKYNRNHRRRPYSHHHQRSK